MPPKAALHAGSAPGRDHFHRVPYTTTAMKKTLKVTVLATAIAAALPFQAQAAGLGGINVFSALGQPLRAEIELHATPEELGTMSAAVPSPEAFRRANLEYSSLMTDLQMKIERRGSNSVIRLSSSRVVNEPFVDVLVELRWAAGSLLREYTFLLDPVENMPAVAAASATSGTARATGGTRSPASASGDRHTVRRGETLHRIALAYLPPGAELEQMLIALLRENPDAFTDGNINRLRAGEALSIPDEIAVAAIPAEQARREVLAHKDEFEAYRNRVASAVAARAPSAEREGGRESAGRVEPRVQDVVRETASIDQVEVSGAPESSEPASAGGLGVRDAQNKPLSEEDLVVLRRELEEMRNRLSELEQTVADQRDIISIRDSMIARLQAAGVDTTQAESAAATPDAKPAETVPPPAPKPATEPKPESKPRPEKPKPAPAPPPPEPSLVDSLMGNPMVLGGGAAIIGLLALLGLRAARRRREEKAGEAFVAAAEQQEEDETLSVVSQPGGESVDTDSGSSVMDTDFSQTGLSAIDADEGVDPVAEADVYLAYGRDAQAEEILLDALKVDASRHAIYLKLLEVYVQRGDRRQFEVIATDLYARTGGTGPDWQKAAGMGRKLDPDNPLYGERDGNDAPAGLAAAGLAAAATGAATGAAAAASATEPRTVPLEETQIGLDHTDLSIPGYEDEAASEAPAGEPAPEDETRADLDFDLGSFGEPPAEETPAEAEPQELPVIDDGNALSFDLDLDEAEAPSESASQPEPEPATPADPADTLVPGLNDDFGAEGPIEEGTVMDLERTEFDANLLDFDLDLSPPAAEAPVAPPQGLDLTSIDLDLELPPQDETPAETAPAAPAQPSDDADPAAVPQFDAGDMQREMETKLELARAYEEMGDREGARELLEEVLKDGTPEQRTEAESMLERLA